MSWLHWQVLSVSHLILREPATLSDESLIKLSAPDSCPLYSAVKISGVTVGESPAWLKTKLEAIGLRPINNVVDITNYALHELGHPLHAFDAAKVDGALDIRMASRWRNLQGAR